MYEWGSKRNKLSKDLLLKRLEEENFERTPISFYRYVEIDDPVELRFALYDEWEALGVLGRIYVAKEGINAQISVPDHNIDKFRENLESRAYFKDMPFKIGIEKDSKAFLKLTIKVKRQIVADDLPHGTYDVSNVGKHLSAEEFNQAMEDSETIVVDMRNQYESRIGKFENAIAPDCDTFREELPMVKEMLKDKKDKKVLLYCTGGIRCEKASAYLKNAGFEDVNQLHGGIISYAHQIKEKGLENKFKGKNFVFDERLEETISDEVLTECDQCEKKCDTYTNCINPICNLLFIQCEECKAKNENCCSKDCVEVSKMSKEERKKLRAKMGPSNFEKYKKRVRPKEKIGSCCSL